jgi:hypothetical protein
MTMVQTHHLGLLALGSILLSPTLAVPTARQDGSSSSWQQYVRASPNTTITPVKVLSTTGNVTNANGILTSGGGDATLSRQSAAEAVPCITVDFGQNTVGLLNIHFAGSQVSPATGYTPGYPSIQLAFSETLEYLTNRSDFTRSDNANPGV